MRRNGGESGGGESGGGESGGGESGARGACVFMAPRCVDCSRLLAVKITAASPRKHYAGQWHNKPEQRKQA
jgi:hypothetical protein